MSYALHDQLATLDRHAQLTRCFCAVAELIVSYYADHVCSHKCVRHLCIIMRPSPGSITYLTVHVSCPDSLTKNYQT